MKKVLLLVVAMATFTFTNAQDDDSTGGPTSEGNIFLEVNTAFGAASGSNTGFALTSVDGESTYNLGAEAGYFIMDGLAVKAGFGYGGSSYDDSRSTFSYKIGAKYYLMDKFPLQLNLNGASIEDADENPLYLGLQGGYAWFLNDHVSIEPGFAYNLSLNEDYSDEGVFQFNIGFAVHL